MTVKKLNNLRSLCIVACAYPAAALFLFSGSLFFQLSGLLAAAVILYFYQRLLVLMERRLDRISRDLLDPALYASELEDYRSAVRTFNMQGDKNRVSRLEAAGHSLLGEYGKAGESTRAIRYKNKKLKNKADTALAYYSARKGNLPAAEALLPGCEARLAEASGDGRAAALHTLGLYALESGDLQKARERLEEALRSAQRNGTLQGVRFDLARLEEKEGDIEKAVEQLKQAAALGAKTWLGQEAARRAEALASEGV